MYRQPVQREYVVYSVDDPALDREASNAEEYKRTLEPSHLHWRQGEAPTEFVLRTPSVRLQLEVRGRISSLLAGAKDEEEAARVYLEHLGAVQALHVRATLREVRGLEGVELPPPEASGLLPEAAIDLLVSADLVAELAGYAQQIGHLSPRPGQSGAAAL